MATLILNAVGAAVGGPIGAAIGAVIGQAIDRRIFAPKGREGPRLADLSLQSSTYGARLPKLFGRMRLAGTVIWATDLKEKRSRQSTGKGQPKATVYSYSASFAVALSSRKAQRIGRIWADGKLLRGEAGDFKAQTMFRFHSGDEGQVPDPHIASVEGASGTPAYRGLAYAVFEDMQLADFGNRIPSITFEVIADEAAVSIGTIAKGISAPEIVAHCPTQLDGFAASGDSVRGVLETLANAVPMIADDDGQSLVLREQPLPGPFITLDDLGASSDDKSMPAKSMSRLASAPAPSALALRHYDPARDYQIGLQRVWRKRDGRADEVIELPASLSASAALSFAENRMAVAQTERSGAEISLPWRYLDLRPGQLVTLPGDARTFRLGTVSFQAMVVNAGLTLYRASDNLSLFGGSGRSVLAPDLRHGPTNLLLLDLPMLQAGVASTPQFFAVAAGVLPGWRRAQLLTSVDDGASWNESGETAAPAVLGKVALPLNDGQPYIISTAAQMIVDLGHSGMTLTSTDIDGLIGGRNLALVGQELIQFQNVEMLSATRARVTGLVRGRRGTEWAMPFHGANEDFVLIDAETLGALAVPIGVSPVRVIASGLGDVVPAEVSVANPNASLLPLSPVHLRTELLANGDTQLSWTRRSRDGWSWLDGVDAPLAEESETYVITVTPDAGSAREVVTFTTTYAFAAADKAADMAGGAAAIKFAISQRGTFGASRPNLLTIDLS